MFQCSYLMLLKLFSNGKTCFVSVFNAIVRVCIQDLPDALEEILAVPLGKDEEKQPLPATSKKWKKLRLIIKTYLTDLLQVRLNSPFFFNSQRYDFYCIYKYICVM